MPEQSQLPYVRTLFLREAPVEPPGVSFVRWAKRDALPLAVAQLELIPYVVFAGTFTHVAAAFLPTALWTWLRRLRATMSRYQRVQTLYMGNSPPRAPAGLGDHGRKLWRDDTAKYLLDPGELAVFEQLGRTVDELGRLNIEAATAPVTVPGSHGQETVNPLFDQVLRHRKTVETRWRRTGVVKARSVPGGA